MVTMGWMAPDMINVVNTLSSAPKNTGDTMSTRVNSIDKNTDTIQILSAYSILLSCEEASIETINSMRNQMGIILFPSVTRVLNWMYEWKVAQPMDINRLCLISCMLFKISGVFISNLFLYLPRFIKTE